MDLSHSTAVIKKEVDFHLSHEQCIVIRGGKLNKKCISCHINKTSNNKTKPDSLCDLDNEKWGDYKRFKPQTL